MSVVVVGGGISGLTACYTLCKHKIPTILVEASSRTGGWIQTHQQNDGVFYEMGPRTLRTTGKLGKNTLQLIEELGLEDKVKPINKSHPAALNRLLCVNRQLFPLPNSPKSLIKTHPPFKKPLYRSILKDVFTRSINIPDDSMYNFMLRRFGKEFADYLADPLCRGIVAGDAKEISVKMVLSPLFEFEQAHGSIMMGGLKFMKSNFKNKTNPERSQLVKKSVAEKWRLISLEGGLKTLPEKLHEKIDKKCMVKKNSTLKLIKPRDDGKVDLIFDNDEVLSADHVISCIPAKQLSPCLPDYPSLQNLLNSICFVDVGVVNLEYEGEVLSHQGFGYLTPSSDMSSKVLGVIFDTCAFPQVNNIEKALYAEKMSDVFSFILMYFLWAF